MWYVHLIAQPKIDDFRSDYFPRKFHYKKEAEALKREVERKGGVARVSKSADRPDYKQK